MTTDGVTLTKRSGPEASPVLLEVSGDRDIAAACPEEAPAMTGMTRASPPRQTATVENVVPRSTPIKVSVVKTERSDPNNKAIATGKMHNIRNITIGNEDGTSVEEGDAIMVLAIEPPEVKNEDADLDGE